MMKLFSNETLQNLIETRLFPCVSIYMPTIKAGQEIRQNPIRMKNLLNEAEERLRELGTKRDAVSAILNPARDLVDQRPFWQEQSHGLALFLSPEDVSIHRLPRSFDEQVVIGRRYFLKPLLPLLSGERQFFLLLLDLHEPRLFQASRYFMDGVEVQGMPGGITEALRYDDPERQLQHQTTSRTDGGHDAIYHGHGDDYDKKENILRYFHQVDAAVARMLGGQTTPLVLAGVDYLLPIYRQANEYPHLLDSGVSMDVNSRTRMEDLREQAWETIEPYFAKQQEQDQARYFAGLTEGLASDNLEEIVGAAYYGRIDTLFLSVEEERCGEFDASTGRVKVGVGDDDGQDLLDYAALHTLKNNGQVYALETGHAPGGGPAAAIFRYRLEQNQASAG